MYRVKGKAQVGGDFIDLPIDPAADLGDLAVSEKCQDSKDDHDRYGCFVPVISTL